jgi:flagellar hook assembly protein FlgD
VGDAPAAIAFGLRAHPNPARGAATIAFDLPRAGDVELALYDLAGRRVRTLARGALPGGRHQVAWDGRDDRGRNVAPGVYLCRIEALGASEARRFIRLR